MRAALFGCSDGSVFHMALVLVFSADLCELRGQLTSYRTCVINLISGGLWQTGKRMRFKGGVVKSDNVTLTGDIQVLS